MFKGPLSSLLTNTHEQCVLFSSLLHVLEDNGGSLDHLNKLLADTNDGRGHLTSLVHALMGDIWDLVETPVYLREIDFDCYENAFRAQYPDILQKRLHVTKAWSETRPASSCKYRLVHSHVRATYDEVKSDGRLHDYAGWRELVAYVARLQSTTLDLVQIVAPGSELRDLDGRDPVKECFPIATRGSEFIEIGWKHLDRKKDERFERNTFYLVRVPA